MSQKNSSSSTKIKRTCFCALFAAIICVCTFIAVPLPIGYFNLGDAAVLLGAWLLGPVFGAVAAAVGSALCDVLMSYVIYAPATAVIKALMAVLAFLLYKTFKRIIVSEKLNFLPRIISAIVAELVMVGGYFLYESLILSYGMGAAASIPGNLLQASAGIVLGTLCVEALTMRGKRSPF